MQKDAIKLYDYELDFIKDTKWVGKSINYVNKSLNDNDLGNDIDNYLYDDGKHKYKSIN